MSKPLRHCLMVAAKITFKYAIEPANQTSMHYKYKFKHQKLQPV